MTKTIEILLLKP